MLDPSLINAAAPSESDDATPLPTSRKPVASKGPRKKKRRPAPPAGPPTTETPSAKGDWRDELTEEDWKESAGRAPEPFVVERTMDPDDVILQTRRYLIELPFADKVALGSMIVLFFSTFLPWRETVNDGDVMGVFSAGIVVTALSAVGLAGLVVRTRKLIGKLNPLLPWIAQLGCIGVSGVWCLVYFKLAWDPTPAQSLIGNYEVWVSKPSIGLVIALLSAITAVVGTILGLQGVGRT